MDNQSNTKDTKELKGDGYLEQPQEFPHIDDTHEDTEENNKNSTDNL